MNAYTLFMVPESRKNPAEHLVVMVTQFVGMFKKQVSGSIKKSQSPLGIKLAIFWTG